MALPRRVLRQVAPLALIFLGSGCAQLQWSSEGPGSPGHKNSVPSGFASTASPASAGSTGAESLPDYEPPAPFSASERERIARIEPWVEQVARDYRMDPDLINAIIWVESRFAPRAKSPAGARGLMQLMPATAGAMARQLGRPLARVYDPEFNVHAGSAYLLGLLDRYDGDETLALAAYNAGSGNVSRWMREDGHLPPRSLQYVDNVQRARRRFVAMRQQRDPDQERTMLAAAPPPARVEPEPRVPAPPRSSSPGRAADRRAPRARSERRAPAPRPNPLAPSPHVYRPEPTPEPPLVDTPYPSLEPTPPRRAEPDQSVEIARPRSLPSVLD